MQLLRDNLTVSNSRAILFPHRCGIVSIEASQIVFKMYRGFEIAYLF